MDSFEWNKIFAALLIAGIVASGSGFIAERLVHAKSVAAHGGVSSGEGTATAAAAPQAPEPILALIAGADIEKGKTLSKACAACHSFDKGGANGVGPNLWNVMSTHKAHADGYAYSAGLAARAGEKWSYDDINHFLWKPKKFISDTKMSFVGLKKPEDRAAIIAWLRTLSDSPPALPSDAAIAAEQAVAAPAEEAPAPTETQEH